MQNAHIFKRKGLNGDRSEWMGGYNDDIIECVVTMVDGYPEPEHMLDPERDDDDLNDHDDYFGNSTQHVNDDKQWFCIDDSQYYQGRTLYRLQGDVDAFFRPWRPPSAIPDRETRSGSALDLRDRLVDLPTDASLRRGLEELRRLGRPWYSFSN